MINSIIFDFDGVLADSVDIKTQAFAELYNEYGEKVVDKVVEHHLANGGISRFQKFKLYHREYLDITLTQDKLIELGENFAEIVKQKVINAPYINGAYRFLKDYHNKYLMFICSGTPDEEIKEITERKGINVFFKGVYGSPRIKEIIIEEIISEFELKRDETIFVGDAITDYNAANSSKLSFLGISKIPDPFPEGTIVIPDLTKLPEVLNLM